MRINQLDVLLTRVLSTIIQQINIKSPPNMLSLKRKHMSIRNALSGLEDTIEVKKTPMTSTRKIILQNYNNSSIYFFLLATYMDGSGTTFSKGSNLCLLFINCNKTVTM